MFDVTKLPPLKAEDWPRVRDIILPVAKESDGDSVAIAETLVESAIAFVGQQAAYRLWNREDKTLCELMGPIVMASHTKVAQNTQRFRIDHQELSFRAQLGLNAAGHDLSLRRLPPDAPTVRQISLPSIVRVQFASPGLEDGGLILIVGPFGQGKTTTASAIVRTRLEIFGGYALTVEDPCEVPLQGVWGKGVCMQRPVEPIDAYEPPGDAFFRSLIGTLRQFPAIPYGTMLMVGEIQDSRTAIETLKAAANGHLVIATLHARSVVDAVRRMSALCAGGRDNLDADTARDMLAAVLRGVWYQRLSWRAQGESWAAGEVTGQLLWKNDGLTRSIRNANYDDITAIAKRQTELLQSPAAQSAGTAEEVERLLSK